MFIDEHEGDVTFSVVWRRMMLLKDASNTPKERFDGYADISGEQSEVCTLADVTICTVKRAVDIISGYRIALARNSL